ncbi:MAG: hypothetical protein VYA55_18890 [Pseudomonadota bacterium]|nr:hypothetical protein [Pseudomonadota bacterium]
MMRYKTVAAAMLLPSLLLTGCGGEQAETQRATSNSANLTGLWRLNFETSQTGLNAEAGITYTLTDNGDEVNMVACAERQGVTLSRDGNTLSGMPVGEATVATNDSINANGSLGDSAATKMSTKAVFDMGSLSVNGGDLGSIASSNICIQSDNARILGQATQERISATTILNGKPMILEISRMGSIGKGTYDVNRDMAEGGIQIFMKSDALKSRINRSEMNLRNGSITITEDSKVWMKGNFNAEMPNGQLVAGNFEFEKP